MRPPTPKNSPQVVTSQLVSYITITLLLFGSLARNASGADFVWDFNSSVNGAQDGGGTGATWADGLGNWFVDSPDPNPDLQNQLWSNSAGNTAIFGAGGSGGAITVSGTVETNGMILRALSSGTPTAYTFSGANSSSIIDLADGSSILIGNGASHVATSAGRITFNAKLTGNDITIGKVAGSTQTAYVTLAGSNTLTGTLFLRSADTGGLFLQANSISSLPSASLTKVDVGVNSTLVLSQNGTWAVPFTLEGSGAGNRGAIRFETSSITLTGAITLAGDTLITQNTNAVTSTINSNIGESGGSRKLTLGTQGTSTGTIILGGNNTFTGGLVIAVTNVTLDNTGALNSAAPNVVTFSEAGATARSLTLNGKSVAVGGLVSTSTSTAITVKNASSTPTTLTIASTTVDSAFAGVLADGDGGGALSVVKTGSFAQTLSGANTFTGGLTLNEGTLNVNHASALGTGTFTINGGTLGNTSGAAVTNANNNAMVWNGDFSAGLTHALNLGTGNVSLGTAAGTTRTVTVNSGAPLTVGGSISDGATATGLTKAGNGVLILGGNSTYTGDTNVNAGQLRITHGSALGTGAGVTNVAGGARLQLDNNIEVTSETLFTPYLQNVGGSNTWGGTVQGIAGNSLTIESTAGDLHITGNVIAEDTSGTDHSFTLTGAGNGEISGVISAVFDPAGGGFNKNGTGTWILSGTNTYATITNVNAGGLQVGKNGQGQTGTKGIDVDANAWVSGTGTIRGPANFSSGSTLYAGDGITAANHGTLTFTSTGAAAYTLATGSTVKLDLGAATTNDVSFGGNAIGSAGYNAWADGIGGAGNHDRLVFNSASGTLTFSSKVAVLTDGYTPVAGDVFNLLDWSVALTADFGGFDVGANYRTGAEDNGMQFDLPDISATGYYWDVSRFTTSGVLLVVPEPGRMLLLGVGLCMLVTRRGRWMRRAQAASWIVQA